MDAKELFREGQGFFIEGKYGESIASFSKAIEAGEKTEIAFLSRGVAYFRIEQFDKAEEDFDNTIKLKSDYGAAFFARSAAYTQTGNEFEAQRSIQSAISCTEASMQWVADHYGMFRTQFDQAMALMPGESDFSESRNEQINNLKKLFEENK
jgi:tetratricopeptide (TPR) repeat protein